ncbi:hypothetical protein CERSUDRAFT_95806 [Gelatoporia subvermispora B]|uniref:Uncharacterized protein n=1 Tax=Ceriporiopsis subvermispora (strain B) TaxID=914234 RepID=M2PJV9_CERS8|nr:hypothetical protein CERSUDRAFT_95806 [Gelatoporia subvermispora B]
MPGFFPLRILGSAVGTHGARTIGRGYPSTLATYSAWSARVPIMLPDSNIVCTFPPPPRKRALLTSAPHAQAMPGFFPLRILGSAVGTHGARTIGRGCPSILATYSASDARVSVVLPDSNIVCTFPPPPRKRALLVR